MPGANQPLELVRLASEASAALVMLGRFPAGFERSVSGGYEVTEEFLVLDGALALEGVRVERGALCFVPGNHVRSPMRSPLGCTVLAWFSGPALFRDADQLSGPTAGFTVVQVGSGLPSGRLLTTSESAWEVTDRVPDHPDASVDVIDLGLTSWAHVVRGQTEALPPEPFLVRRPLPSRDA